MPRGVDLDLNSPTKQCPKCGEHKPWEAFHKSKSTKSGYNVYCRACQGKRHDAWRRNNLAYAAQKQKEYRKKNPERFRDYERKHAYGLAPGQYAEILTAQKGKCAICKRAENNGRGGLHVDHCHEQGHVRGLLCHGCNVSLGHFQHDIAVLEAAIQYLNQTLKKTR